MKISAILIARGGSKGIPRKNLLNFCGKPLLSWTIEQCKNCSLINEIYMSTEDQEIANISSEFGASDELLKT